MLLARERMWACCFDAIVVDLCWKIVDFRNVNRRLQQTTEERRQESILGGGCMTYTGTTQLQKYITKCVWLIRKTQMVDYKVDNSC